MSARPPVRLNNHPERMWVCDFIQTHDLLFDGLEHALETVEGDRPGEVPVEPATRACATPRRRPHRHLDHRGGPPRPRRHGAVRTGKTLWVATRRGLIGLD